MRIRASDVQELADKLKANKPEVMELGFKIDMIRLIENAASTIQELSEMNKTLQHKNDQLITDVYFYDQERAKSLREQKG